MIAGLLGLSLALAAPPDKAPATFEGGEDAVEQIMVSAAGDFVAFQASQTLYVLDVDDWSIHSSAPCAVTAAAFVPSTEDDEYVYVTCEDGTVRGLTWSDGELVEILGDDAEPEVEVIGDDVLLDLFWYAQSGILYVLSENSDNTVGIHTLDPEDGTLNGRSGFPATTLYTGFTDADVTTTRVVISHGGDDISSLAFGSSTVIRSTTNLAVQLEDIVGNPRESVLGVDSKGWLVEYLLSSASWQVLFSDLENPTSVGLSRTIGDEWMVLALYDWVEVYEVANGALVDSWPVEGFVVETEFIEIDTYGDYAYGGTWDGYLVVMTACPWVSDVAVSPAEVQEGDELKIAFTSDEPGSYEVLIGGTREGDGQLLASGDLEEAGQHEVVVEAQADWPEAEIEVFVLVTGYDGLVGHGATSIVVDNPPDPPDLTAASVGFANQALVLSFDGIEDEDLDHYDVYVTTQSFSPSDWRTGGPSYAGPDELTTPIAISAAGGDRVSERIEPLTNGVTYYIAVRSIDAGGLEGAMSNVVEGIPKPSSGAAEITGERGGPPDCSCGHGSLALLWAPVLLGGGALLLRRRRYAALVAALSVASVGHAKDYTPAWGNFELRYGGISLADVDDEANPIEVVYGQTGNEILQLEAGPQLFRYAEIDLGIGFFQELAWKLDAETELRSAERTMLTWWPLSAGLTLRGHFVDEQVVVPFVRVGGDYLMWNERWDDGAGGKEKISGAKLGWHYGFGGNLLLDTFAPGRASMLESQTGINDTFIVVEWRRQVIEDGQGLVFSGDLITAGLKLDY